MTLISTPEPIRELVYRHLRDRILAGHFEYGVRLIESELSQELGVSRTPVREALRKLELEGLVHYLSRRGVMVTNLALADMEDIYDLREVLEGLAARRAAERRTDAEATEIEALCQQMEQVHHTNDLDQVTAVHTRFNELLYRLSGNKRLCETLNRYNEYVAKSQYVSMTREGRAEEIMAEHRSIVGAIVARDPVTAEFAARQHIANARTAYFSRRPQPGAESR